MSRTLLISVPVEGSTSLVSIELVGHDHQIARTLDHKPGTGRWIDQYEVRRYADDRAGIQRHVTQRKSLELARQVASKLYRDAADRVATHKWAEAERTAPHFHRDQDINAG